MIFSSKWGKIMKNFQGARIIEIRFVEHKPYMQSKMTDHGLDVVPMETQYGNPKHVEVVTDQGTLVLRGAGEFGEFQLLTVYDGETEEEILL